MVGKLQMDLLVMAMACDLTRVGTIQWEQSVGNVRFTWVDPAITRGHHDMSHDGDDVATTMDQLTKINTWYAGQLNYLIDSLKNAKETDGTSMLDNTLIVWVNELSRGTPTRTTTCRSCSRAAPAVRCARGASSATPRASRTTTCWSLAST